MAVVLSGSVLIVDDDETHLKMMTGMLERTGLQTTTANHARAALALVAKMPFDAVISDIYMPDVNGIDLLAALRDGGYAMPVLLLTGGNTPQLILQALRLGAFDFITKPFDVGNLIASVGRAAEYGRRRQQIAAATAAGLSALNPDLANQIERDHRVLAQLQLLHYKKASGE